MQLAAGAQANAQLLYAWFRLSGQDRLIKAGNYEIPAGTTPRSLLRMLVRGSGITWTLLNALLLDSEYMPPGAAPGCTDTVPSAQPKVLPTSPLPIRKV
eukprot:gene42895-53221_t